MRPTNDQGERFRHPPVGGGAPRGAIGPVQNEHERATVQTVDVPGHFVGRSATTGTVQGQTGRRYTVAGDALPAAIKPGDAVVFDVATSGGLAVGRNVRRAGDCP